MIIRGRALILTIPICSLNFKQFHRTIFYFFTFQTSSALTYDDFTVQGKSLQSVLLHIDQRITLGNSQILPKVPKIVIFVYVYIKCYVYFDKIYVRCCQMCIVCSKVNFSQISLILLKFTYFINFYNNKNTIIKACHFLH